MAIHLTEESKVLVQGMTGTEGMRHTLRMLAAGTDVVGGVNPRKAGRTVGFGDRAVPVFGSVRDAREEIGADVSVLFVFVPPAAGKAAVMEAADAGIPLAVVITEGIPVHDAVAFHAHARRRERPPFGASPRPSEPGSRAPGTRSPSASPPRVRRPPPGPPSWPAPYRTNRRR